jgi:hypothetical protein
MKSRDYISDELIHWTGRDKTDDMAFAALKTICQEEILRLSYCPNYTAEDYNPKAAMVCFTDIPLRYSKEHCGKFGRFGVAFKKSRMIAYGANPALYTTGVHHERIRNVGLLLARMEDLEKDREWRSEVDLYSFTEDETVAMQEVTDFLQEYSYKYKDDGDYVTYYQREWRLTFRSLPFSGGTREHPPGKSCFYIREGKTYSIFKFAPDDVEYLVVPLRYWWQARCIAKKIRCGVKVYELSVHT